MLIVIRFDMGTIFSNIFQSVRKIRITESWCVIIATVFLVIEFVVTRYCANPALIRLCQIATCVFAVLSMLLGLLSDHLLYQAEEEKRKDLFDNSFGSHLAEHNASSYYSNDAIPKGIKKLAINNFESSFFTKSILKAGMGRNIAVFVIVVLVYIVVSIVASRDAVVLLVQSALPVNITIEFVRTCSTYFRVNKLYHAYRVLFDNNSNPRTVDLLSNVLSYTAALAYGKTLLNEKLYEKINTSLSKEWEMIRTTLNLD